MNMEFRLYGKEESVKETHQGFLSRSIPARRRRSAQQTAFAPIKKDTLKRVFFYCVITTLKMNPRLVEVASISSKIKHVSAKYVLHHIELSLFYLIRFWISSTDGSCFSSSSGSLLVT